MLQSTRVHHHKYNKHQSRKGDDGMSQFVLYLCCAIVILLLSKK